MPIGLISNLAHPSCLRPGRGAAGQLSGCGALLLASAAGLLGGELAAGPFRAVNGHGFHGTWDVPRRCSLEAKAASWCGGACCCW